MMSKIFNYLDHLVQVRAECELMGE